MATHSSIEWTDTTWNPVVGCTKVSEGCRNCYAMRMAARLAAMAGADIEAGRDPGRKGHYVNVVRYAPDEPGKDRVPLPQWNNKVALVENALADPLRWKKPRRVFVNSMSDLFHEQVPDEFIDRVFAIMALCPQHTFQVLTKRPERMAEYFRSFSAMYQRARIAFNPHIAWPPDRGRALDIVSGMRAFRAMKDEPLPNVWLGCSIEDQKTADERIPHLLRCPSAVWFVSCEPLLGEIELCIPEGCRGCNHPGNVLPRETCTTCGGTGYEPSIHWVIVGGESGPGARPCNIEWIRSIVQQCKAAGVPVFTKQVGSVAAHEIGSADRKGGRMQDWPEDIRVREFPEVEVA